MTIILTAASALALAASTQAEGPAPCSSPEYRQLDFWVGNWALEFDRADGTVGTATNRITKDEYGPCAIVERFEMPGGYKGTSYSIYDRETKQWRQMWVDNNGGNFTLVGGPAEGADHAFELRTVGPRGPEQSMRRMIWEDVEDDRLTWRWQSLQPDGSWKDQWVLRYERADGAD